MNTAAPRQTLLHSTFSVKRSYPFAPARVFAAFANQATKRRWYVEGEGFDIDEFTMDFRIGGRELIRFRFQGGEPIINDGNYLDIAPEERIILTFTMKTGARLISISLATIEFKATGTGTQLLYTEQGAFFDVTDKMANRKAGTRELFDRLDEELRLHV